MFVASRIAVGLELATLGSNNTTSQWTAVSTGLPASSSDSRSAWGIYGVLRARAVKSARANLDVVAGFGRQFTRVGSWLTTTKGTSGWDNDVSSWMYAFGADAPIAVARHFVVSPFARVYLLHGYAESRYEEYGSFNTAISLGVSAGVKW